MPIKQSKSNDMSVIGAIAPAVASLAGNIINNVRAKKAHAEMLRYNHPKEQVKRLKEAGLSPSYMYGAGSGAASTSPTRETPELDLETAGNAIQNMIMLQQQKELLKKMQEEAKQEKIQTSLLADEAKYKLDDSPLSSWTGAGVSMQGRTLRQRYVLQNAETFIKRREADIQKAADKRDSGAALQNLFDKYAIDAARAANVDASTDKLKAELERFKAQNDILKSFKTGNAVEGFQNWMGLFMLNLTNKF